jgi:hypothetical protein
MERTTAFVIAVIGSSSLDKLAKELPITVEYNRRWGLKVLNPDLPTKVN